MQIALYKGKSLVSLAIRWITRSEYSHAAFRFDEDAERMAIKMSAQEPFNRLHFFCQGSVVEAWEGGVKNSYSLSSLHTPGTQVDIFELVTPLTELEERALIGFIDVTIGEPYSYLNVLRFLTRRPGNLDKSWFCSELCFEAFQSVGSTFFKRTEAWRVPPDWLQRSPLLKFKQTMFTS